MWKSLFFTLCPESWRVENWRILVEYRILLIDVILQLRSPHMSFSPLLLCWGPLYAPLEDFWPVSAADAVTEASILCSTHPTSHWCVSQGCSLLLCCAITHQSLLMLLAESVLHSGLPKGPYYFPPPPLFLYLTYLHAPVALHVMQTVNTETLNRTKLCVNPKCAEYTSVWNKVYRERRWACYGRTEWRASVHNRSYLLPGRRAEEMLAGHLLTEDWLQEGQQITKEECCCSSADWPRELIRESICPQKQLCSGGAKSLFHCSHFSLKSREAICKSWWCHFSSFGYNNPWERKMPKTQPVCFIPLSCTANHMASCPI